MIPLNYEENIHHPNPCTFIMMQPNYYQSIQIYIENVKMIMQSNDPEHIHVDIQCMLMIIPPNDDECIRIHIEYIY